MISDRNKGIDVILYNHLNLPTEIHFESGDKIYYFYNATGQKVEKTVMMSTQGPTSTLYLDGFQYKNDVLQFFFHPEGYVNYTPALIGTQLDGSDSVPAAYNYVFNFKDHLGNIRLSYAQDPSTGLLKVIEEDHYYPFGLKHTNYNSTQMMFGREENQVKLKPKPFNLKTSFKYKYNGKEWQDELGLNMYDYGARNYDPAIGRWMNIDPLAETSRRFSPYTYCLNNPVFFIDPDGMSADLGINGPESRQALDQLQASVGSDITLRRNDVDGTIDYTNNTGMSLTGNAAKLASVIDNHSIVVNVDADNSNNSILYGEAFMGNTVTSNTDSESGKKIVKADQAINTRQTASLDRVTNKPGATILHGVVEASEGAKISQASGISSPKEGVPGSVYSSAHSAAELIAPQPAQIDRVANYYGPNNTGTGVFSRIALGRYLGNSSSLGEGIIPNGTISITFDFFANGQRLDK